MNAKSNPTDPWRLARAAGLGALSAATLLVACAPASSPSPEAASQPANVGPANVGLAKLAATRYHDSGDYMRDLARAAAPANDWLR